jgi:hypothetical protein
VVGCGDEGAVQPDDESPEQRSEALVGFVSSPCTSDPYLTNPDGYYCPDPGTSDCAYYHDYTVGSAALTHGQCNNVWTPAFYTCATQSWHDAYGNEICTYQKWNTRCGPGLTAWWYDANTGVAYDTGGPWYGDGPDGAGLTFYCWEAPCASAGQYARPANIGAGPTCCTGLQVSSDNKCY